MSDDAIVFAQLQLDLLVALLLSMPEGRFDVALEILLVFLLRLYHLEIWSQEIFQLQPEFSQLTPRNQIIIGVSVYVPYLIWGELVIFAILY